MHGDPRIADGSIQRTSRDATDPVPHSFLHVVEVAQCSSAYEMELSH